MGELLPFVVIGLTVGGVYALASLGLVLTYRTSGVFNFAHGAIGMFSTYVFYRARQEMPTAAAVLLAVLVVAPLLGLTIDRLLLRRLDGATPATYVVASLGLLVALQSAAVALFGPDTRRVAAIFPTGTFRVGGVNVGVDQALVVAVAVAAGVGLIVFFRHTRLGLQTRAVVADRSLSGLTGVNTGVVTAFSWMLGSAFAATSGILFSPFIGLDSLLLTLLVVQAFGAAVVGRLRSFPVTTLAAFGLGVAQSVATKLVSDVDVASLAGLPSALPFLVLVGVLLLYRKDTLQEMVTPAAIGERWGRRRIGRPRFPTAAVAAFITVAAVLPPFLSGSRRLTLTAMVAFVLLFSSLSLLVGLSGQVSLAHAVFVVFGATTLAHLLTAGVPYVVALPAAALVLVPVGAALAFPAIRLSGLYLALATFGFGILAQNLLFPTALAFGQSGLVTIDRPGFLTGDLGFFYFVLAVAAAGVVAVEGLRVTRLGRVLRALADSPRAVESLGISSVTARLLAFCLSAFLAALAGGLLGTMVRSVNPESFHFFQSLVWITVLVAAGPRTFGGCLLAAALLVGLPAFVEARWFAQWQPVAFGVGAILLAQADNGLVGFFRRPDFSALVANSRRRRESTRALERHLAARGCERGLPSGVRP
ncbi:MAG: ABC transporter permease [Actinomycetota bacterium]|jgi:branched-subunit amino acid ABC-type transport system permease component